MVMTLFKNPLVVSLESRNEDTSTSIFFTSVDPIPQAPSRDTHQNWKVHPLFKHTLQVSKEAVFMGRNLSCDEQTIGLQGHQKDKQIITYNKEGYWFLADCICSDGYTFYFLF